MKLIATIFFATLFATYSAQDFDERIELINQHRDKLVSEMEGLDDQIEVLKLEEVIYKLKSVGLPSEDYVSHSAMILAYDENHKQAKWVAHMIVPDILDSFISRTNDFRADPKITSGTAVEADYFLKELVEDSVYAYDGFGYDRGHLAPSAAESAIRVLLLFEYYTPRSRS